MLQWRVTITDSDGEEWPFIVAADGERGAEAKAREYWGRQKTPKTWLRALKVQRETS